MTVDLIAFLSARLDEDERATRSVAADYGDTWTVAGEDWVRGSNGADVISEPGAPTAHMARHDPARVLREIEAKRQILALHGGDLAKQSMFCGHCEHDTPCPTLRLLALPYADHPDYRDVWRS